MKNFVRKKMGNDDWYRNERWDSEVKDIFYKILSKKRDKGEYIIIQATYLEEILPQVAINLIEENIAHIDNFDKTRAYYCVAKCYVNLRQFDKAIEFYEKCLDHQKTHQNCFRCDAYIEMPFLVARNCLLSRFDEALKMLLSLKYDSLILNDKFKWAYSLAVIYSKKGMTAQAMKYATIGKQELDPLNVRLKSKIDRSLLNISEPLKETLNEIIEASNNLRNH